MSDNRHSRVRSGGSSDAEASASDTHCRAAGRYGGRAFRSLPRTVRGSAEVLVTYRDYGDVRISATPGFVAMSSGLTVSVARGTLDVSIHAPKVSPGNA